MNHKPPTPNHPISTTHYHTTTYKYPIPNPTPKSTSMSAASSFHLVASPADVSQLTESSNSDNASAPFSHVNFFNKYGIPKTANVTPAKGTSLVWNNCVVLSAADAVGANNRACLFCSTDKYNSFLADHKGSPTLKHCMEYNDWKTGKGVSVFSNTGNFSKHLRLHENESNASMDNTQATKRKIVKAETDYQASHSKKQFRQRRLFDNQPAGKDDRDVAISEMLLEAGLPFHVTEKPKFWRMVQVMTGQHNVTLPSQDTYNSHVNAQFTLFAERLAAKLAATKEKLVRQPFVNVVHDMWTNASKDGILGCTIVFIDERFVFWNIPVLAAQNNYSHSAQDVADQIKAEILSQYKVDIEQMTKFVISDTASSARNVADHFEDVIQKDCDMHVLNLILQYGLGMKENHRNHQVTTLGGEFKAGIVSIKSLRRLSAYFVSPQRLSKLKQFTTTELNRKFYAPILDGETRVAYALSLIRRSFYLFDSYFLFFQQNLRDKGFREMKSNFESIDWALLAEMEAVSNYIAHLATKESQRGGVTASYYLYHRIRGFKSLHAESFQCLETPPRVIRQTNTEDDLVKSTRLVTTLSPKGMVCLSRLQHQYKVRYLKVTNESVFASLLDPRTKGLTEKSVTYLRDPTLKGVAGNSDDNDPLVLESPTTGIDNSNDMATYMAAFKEEHRRVFKLIKARNNLKSTNTVVLDDNANNVPDVNAPLDESGLSVDDGSESDTDSIAEEIPEDTNVHADDDVHADKMVDDWIEFAVDWCKVAKLQCEDELDTRVLKKVRRTGGTRKETWDADALREHIDILRWFRCNSVFNEKGKFESIGVMARIYLAQVESGALQERVFSIAKHIQNKLRTSTDATRHAQQLILRLNMDTITALRKELP